MGAPSKRAKKIRQETEFSLARLKALLAPPKDKGSLSNWTLAQIFAARDAQMRGQFMLPAQMAESMRTDDALAVAFENRLAPQSCIKVEIKPAKKGRGESIATEAEALFGQDGIGLTPETLADIHGCLVNHGVAFAYNIATPRDDGSRIDFEVHSFPIEFVKWDSNERCFKARLEDGTEENIVHGDGRWIVFAKHELDPWKQQAALLPAAIVWARHAYSLRDWAKSSLAHGNAKVIGEMPEGMPLQNEAGELTEEAAAFLELLKAIASQEIPVGIRPAGSKVDYLANSSNAWQVFVELARNADKSAARIYLGTDGTLGTDGGAPGIDIQSLFGVAATRVEGDLRCIERAIRTGSIEPWTAINFGDSLLAPKRVYLIPDKDADVAREAYSKRMTAFWADIEAAKKNGFVVDQSYVDAVAEKHGVEAPELPEKTDQKAPSIQLAPTDAARIITVNEGRASVGLPELLLPDGQLDPNGRLTVEEYASKKKAQADAASQAPAPVPAPQPQ